MDIHNYILKLPTCVVQYILSLTDTITTLKFSMTNKYNYNKFYPHDGIIKLKNKLDEIKGKIKKQKFGNYTTFNEYVLYLINTYDDDHIYGFCDDKYCTICKQSLWWSRFEYNTNPLCMSGRCYTCTRKCIICNKDNIDKISRCVICNEHICDNNCSDINYKLGGFDCECYSSLTDGIICHNCSIITYYCGNCKQKKCPLCIKNYGNICTDCK